MADSAANHAMDRRLSKQYLPNQRAEEVDIQNLMAPDVAHWLVNHHHKRRGSPEDAFLVWTASSRSNIEQTHAATA